MYDHPEMGDERREDTHVTFPEKNYPDLNLIFV